MASKYRERLLKSSGVSNTKFESQYAKKLMLSMGWKQGNGLGRTQSGSTECVQVRRRDDNIGLGRKGNDNEDNWKDMWWSDKYNESIKKLKILPKKLKKLNKKAKDSSSDDDSSSSGDDSSPTVPIQPFMKKTKNIAK